MSYDPFAPRPHPNAALYGEYQAKCSLEGCAGQRVFTHGLSAGLRTGDAIKADPTNSEFGKCPICKRYTLVITKSPELPPPPRPKGFVRIPEK